VTICYAWDRNFSFIAFNSYPKFSSSILDPSEPRLWNSPLPLSPQRPMLCPLKGWLTLVSDKIPMSSLLISLLRIDHQIVTVKHYDPHLPKSGLWVFYQILIGQL
jgi:hypothetical protein